MSFEKPQEPILEEYLRKPKHEAQEPRLSWLEGMRAFAKRNIMRAGLYGLIWFAVSDKPFSQTGFVETAKGSKNAFTVEVGQGNDRIPLSVYTLENFDPKGGDRALVPTPSTLELFGASTEDALEEKEMRELEDYYQEQLKRPEILAHADLTPEYDLDAVTPRQAVLLARAIVVENLFYDTAIAQDTERAEKSDAATDELSKKLRSYEPDSLSTHEIYLRKKDIICRNAQQLFNRNFSYIQVRHGAKNLQQTFTRGIDGSPEGKNTNPRFSHAWNLVLQDKDSNNDGIVDGLEMTVIDSTPYTRAEAKDLKEMSRFFGEQARGLESFETLESIALLRRSGAIKEKEYVELYKDMDIACTNHLKNIVETERDHSGDYIEIEEPFTLNMKKVGIPLIILRAFAKGAVTEGENIFFQNKERQLIEMLLATPSGALWEHAGYFNFQLADTILARYEKIAELHLKHYQSKESRQKGDEYIEEMKELVRTSAYPYKEAILDVLNKKRMDRAFLEEVKRGDLAYIDDYFYENDDKNGDASN